jgi:hypothetical protein
MQRYNQVGCLLPEEDDFDPTNAAALAEAKLILAEMAKVKAELEAMLGLPLCATTTSRPAATRCSSG